MATGSVLLSPGSATLYDGTTSNATPGMVRVKGTATAPAPYYLGLAFDASTREQVAWSFRMPIDYASTPAAKIQFYAAATSGAVVFECRLAAITPGDSQIVADKVFASANTSSAATVPGTAGYLAEVSLPLSNADSLAAGDWMVLYLARDAAHASDTATGDVTVIGVSLEYTTA